MLRKKLTRKQFLLCLGGAAGAGMLATLPGLGRVAKNNNKRDSVRDVRVIPVKGVRYNNSFLEFIKDARFESPRHAIMSIGNPDLEYSLTFSHS
jgi:hypothetical protein